MPPQENPHRESGQPPPRPRPDFPVDRPLQRPIGDVRLQPRPIIGNRPAVNQPPLPPAQLVAGVPVASPVYPDASSVPLPPAPPSQPAPVAGNTYVPQPAPPSKHRRFTWLSLKMAGLIVLAGLAVAAVAIFLAMQAARNNPVRVFNDALTNAMTTSSVQIDSSKDGSNSQTLVDLSGGKNISRSATASIQMDGAPFDLKAYGTPQNTYVSYQKLPSSVSAKVNAAVQGGWVQLRAKGLQPPDVPVALSSLSDPFSQAFGPVILGNYAQKTRQQLLTYVAAQHIYTYDPKQVTTPTVEGVKVNVFKVKLNVGYLKIVLQSAANAQGIKPADVTPAAAALDKYKDSPLTFYVGANDHRFQKIVATLSGSPSTTTYSHYNATQLSGEPQTKLTWHDFASVQWQLESEAAAHQPAAMLDNMRKASLASLHPLFAQYFAQNNSYPTLANLNDKTWVMTNLPSADPENFRDPLAQNLTLSASPKPATFAYQATGINPKIACGAADNPCIHYRLTGTLGAGQQFIVQDP